MPKATLIARRLLYLLGIVTLVLSMLAALPVLWVLGCAMFVPDPSGSPDARGMLFAAGLVGLAFVSAVALAGIAMIVFFKPAKPLQTS